MTQTVFNVVLIFLFILIGGVFAAAEMALVSLRDSQVTQLARRSKRGRLIAQLTANPNRFLSAVQIGVTLAGFLSAAFGGTTIAKALAPVLQDLLPISRALADTIAVVVVTAVISYVSIVLGELTAKRLALQRADAFALTLAPVVELIAKLARPAIWLLDVSTNLAVRVLGGNPEAGRDEVTAEEIRTLVRESSTLGAEEREIVDDVLEAGSVRLREVMLPRTEVTFLSGSIPVQEAVPEMRTSPHSRYPVIGASVDDIVGFVHIRDLLDPLVDAGTTVVQLARPALLLPETVDVLHALTELRRTANHLAVVVDEFGGTAGIVTMEILVEQLVGDITDEYDNLAHEGRQAADRQDHIDGLTTIEEFADQTGYALPDGPYDTLAGYFMTQTGQVPRVNDRIEVNLQPAGDEERRARLELRVTEVDGRRASWFAVRPTTADVAADPPS
ncbi:MAG TPA: hemolysin family protein [Propionibacteriaceae bacterium]|nr:hemolysin family protein [Propionibacteriaceae bacterium]